MSLPTKTMRNYLNKILAQKSVEKIKETSLWIISVGLVIWWAYNLFN